MRRLAIPLLSFCILQSSCYCFLASYPSRFNALTTEGILVSNSFTLSAGPLQEIALEKRRSVDSNRYITLAALAALIVQNSGLTVAMRLSRVSKEASSLYISSTAVVVSELLKTIISFYAFCFSNRHLNLNAMELLYLARNESFHSIPDTYRVAIPSSLYVVQNNLQYVAASNLPAEIYQVLIQMKLIVTALFSMHVLKKFQSLGQWVCILLLSIGLAIVQLSFGSSSSSVHVNLVIGISSVVLSCITSGFAGTYHEFTLKQKNIPLAVRNIQMSSISFILALCGCLCDWKAILKNGFFHGYDPLVLLVIILHSMGGLIISVVVKYTSSIVKGFATSASIILSCLLSHYVIRDFQMSMNFFIGAATVCLSAMGYSYISMRSPSVPAAAAEPPTTLLKPSSTSKQQQQQQFIIPIVETKGPNTSAEGFFAEFKKGEGSYNS